MEGTDELFEKTESSFKTAAIKEVLKLQWKDDKTRINDEAIEMMVVLTRKICLELIMRAINQAQIFDENEAVVTVEHVEKVLPQILLDF